MTDAEMAARHPHWSKGYDDAAAGRPHADTQHFNWLARRAYDFGYSEGQSIQCTVSSVNEGDPSGDYLTRRTVQSMKWRM